MAKEPRDTGAKDPKTGEIRDPKDVPATPIDYSSDFAFRGSTGTSTGSGTQGSSSSGQLGQEKKSEILITPKSETDVSQGVEQVKKEGNYQVLTERTPAEQKRQEAIRAAEQLAGLPNAYVDKKEVYVSPEGMPQGKYKLNEETYSTRKATLSDVVPSKEETLKYSKERKQEVNLYRKKSGWEIFTSAAKEDFFKRMMEGGIVAGASLAAGPEVALGVGTIFAGTSLYSGYQAYKQGQLIHFLGSATPSLLGGFVVGGIVNAKSSGFAQGYYEALPLPSRVKGRISREFLYSKRLGQIERGFGKTSLEAQQFKTEYEVAFGKPAVRYFNPMSEDFLIPSNIKLSRERLVSEYSAGSVSSAKGSSKEFIDVVNKALIENEIKVIGSGTLGIKGRPIGDIDAQTGGPKVAKQIYEKGLSIGERGLGYDEKFISKFGEKGFVTIRGKEFLNIGSSPSYYYGQINPNLNLFEFKRFGAFVKSPRGFTLASARDQLRVKFEKGYFLPGALERLSAVRMTQRTKDVSYLEKAPGRAKDIFDIKEVVGDLGYYSSLKQSERLFRTPKIRQGELNGKTRQTKIREERAKTGQQEYELQYRGGYATGRAYSYPYTQKEVGYYGGLKRPSYYSDKYIPKLIPQYYPQGKTSPYYAKQPTTTYYPREKVKPQYYAKRITRPQYYGKKQTTPYYARQPTTTTPPTETFKFKRNENKKERKFIKEVKFGKIDLGYTPSLTALSFDIIGKPSDIAIKSGLGIRPLIRGK